MRGEPLRRVGVLVGAVVLAVGLVPGAATAKPKYKPAPTGATITKFSYLTKNKRQADITVRSPSLPGVNPKVRLLLPKKWSRNSKRTWPIVYLYHGGHDDWRSWTRKSSIASIASKYDVIVAMPEGANGSYTNWYNYGKYGTPKWEDFHIKEVIPLLERNFRASKTAAVMGNSSGGQGAMTYAARYPRKFKYAASLSGLLHLRAPFIPQFLYQINSGNGQDPNAIWGRYPADAANWRLHNPYDLVEGLRGTKIFFSSGTAGQPGPGDPQDLQPWDIGLVAEQWTGHSVKYFRDKLKEKGIPYTAHLYAKGTHNWPAWKRETAWVWPRIMKTIGAKKY
ncbi:esterase family protein [Actinocorallia sp. API 0066]|uniref:alpha/beta hydrolase n=1 Tax=Actinocorallia sp. API 0066 TaxID=2896846 RepID=UPI001E4CFA15|nr:alpha/beta hydrolase-fold protein [Actinocorallia sp. API 0066]MCD0450569.1 esterase family protein [Actinocorallia sp. API 0066]